MPISHTVRNMALHFTLGTDADMNTSSIKKRYFRGSEEKKKPLSLGGRSRGLRRKGNEGRLTDLSNVQIMVRIQTLGSVFLW